MTRGVDWSGIQWLSPGDFKHPDRLDYSVVKRLDSLASDVGRKPTILDDFRFASKNQNSQHLEGRAIDFTLPDLPVDTVLTAIRSNGFTGFGVYVNAAGILSYHVDTRTDRTPDNPATWGGRKDTADQTDWSYVGLRSLLDYMKPAVPVLVWAVLMLIGVYWTMTSGDNS